jgi:nucleoside-diphosphate-sugar epimerase
MRILVLGGGGFIGRHLCYYLKNYGYEVHQTGHTSPDLPKLDILQFSNLVEEISRIKPDVVINLSGRLVRSNPSENDFVVNADGPKNLVNAIKQLEFNPFLIHLASSSEPLGTELIPESEYGKTKAIGSRYVKTNIQDKNLRGVIVCAHNVYGKNLPKDKLISQIFLAALRNENILLNYPNRVRDFVFIEDFVEVLRRIINNLEYLEKENIQYLEIGTGYGTSLYDLAKEIYSITGRNFELTRTNEIDGNPHRILESNPRFDTTCKAELRTGLESIKGEFV